jgi:hypothetical protein
MPIFHVQYEVVPAPDSPAFAEVGGAFVNCWVTADSLPSASTMAHDAIRDGGWTIIALVDECREVGEQSYDADDDALPYFRQAVEDGECFVYHQWPVDVHDGDSIH